MLPKPVIIRTSTLGYYIISDLTKINIPDVGVLRKAGGTPKEIRGDSQASLVLFLGKQTRQNQDAGLSRQRPFRQCQTQRPGSPILRQPRRFQVYHPGRGLRWARASAS